MINRRIFLKTAALASGAMALGRRAWPFAQSPTNIRKFVVSLPGVGPSAQNEIGQYLPLATKSGTNFAGIATDSYDLAAGSFSQQMHPDLPGKTTFFGYADRATPDQKYLGGVIVATKNTPVLMTVQNLLPGKHILPVDNSIMAGANGLTVGDLPHNRIATHLHGGKAPWFSDGTPFQWHSPTGEHGASFMNVPGYPVPAGSASHYFPNQQSARFLWYHDHAIGITRLNAYSGIASAYLLIDDLELSLVGSGLLPDLVGIPLVIQDKSFVPVDIERQDPTWEGGGPGSLWYPHRYEVNVLPHGRPNPEGRWDWGPTIDPAAHGTDPLPPVSCVPEAFFDTILVNGGLYPKVEVAPRRTRFRILNGSQARFYHMNLYYEDPSNPGEAKVGAAGPTMYQFATEGGFLPKAAIHKNKTALVVDAEDEVNPDGPFNLLVAPGERAEMVVDFNGVAPGTTFILYNDAVAPFPGGDTRNDYFTGSPDQSALGGAPSTRRGFGPNTRTLLKIVVGAGAGDSLSTSRWLPQLNAQLKTNYLNGNQPGLLYHEGDPSEPAFPFKGTAHRMLTLNENFDEYGRLIQTLGTFEQNGFNNQGQPTWARGYLDPATENVAAGSVEVWQIMNLTGDTHPIHFHLLDVQVIQRQPFTGDPNGWSYSGPPVPPDANELGWKETVRMNPGEVTTIITQFNLPPLPTSAMRNAVSPRTGGREYVWHCHILEHEEHDMMRPFIVR
jgi:spore coat protein A